jgi:hypothetical protein
VTIDPTRPLDGLIRGSELVIISCSSGTTWSEAIALDAALLIYCDPRKTHLEPGFADDLAASCRWVRSAGELREEVAAIAASHGLGDRYRGSPEARRRFLERYVLHAPGRSPDVRAAEVLADLSATHG